MTDAPDTQLEKALLALENLLRSADRLPGRWEARDILIPLGQVARASGTEAIAPAVERIQRATGEAEDAWRRAVEEELALACAEHIQGTDPRFLGLPNFDWEYVLQARERLQDRVEAAEALAIPAPEALWQRVLEADDRVRDGRPSS